MNAIQLLLLSVLIFGLGAFASLLLNNSSRSARMVSGIAGMLGSLACLGAAISAGLSRGSEMALPVWLPFGQLVLQMDGLSALMVGLIAVIGFACCLFSISYLEEYEDRSLGVLGFFTNIFIATMLMVVTVSNGFYFLLFWEMMTLSSYFLVVFEMEKKETVRAGFLYMLVAHAGSMLIMIAFLILFLKTGSFDFSAFRQAGLSNGLKSLVFLLAFVGFGAKAGMVPLHIWLPLAHPAAPSHASALLSSIMIKTAIYGILRVCVDFLGASILWWGLLVLFFGAISAVFGVLFALTERDLKRMLAYSSVENIGIILLGVGTGMIGLAEGLPVVTLLGFLAALYHVVNHSFFKALLFLGAGSLSFRVHTRDLNRMGGLSRRMPWTSLGFLTGALAISVIPPFNGFVSEWFTYQSFFAASSSQDFAVRVFAPLAAVLLAATGALAAMCFIKAFSGAFSGPAHSEAARQAQEAPGGMVASTIFLAAGCLLLGIGAPLVAPYLSEVAAGISGMASLPVAHSLWVYPAEPGQAILSTPLAALLLLGLLSVPLIVIAAYNGFKAGRRTVDDPWACGYGYSSRMSVSPNSFDQPVKSTFRPIYAFRTITQVPFKRIVGWSSGARTTIARLEPVIERLITRPTSQVVGYLGEHIQALQMGDIRLYCFYIVITLAVLLIVIFR